MKVMKNLKASKTLNFEVTKIADQKDATGALKIEGYANTMDKDRVGDVVLPKAFEKSLPLYLDNPVLLFQHNWDAVIGTCEDVKITDKGLFIKAKISAAKDCDDVRTKIREGALRTLSIGYNELDSDFNESTKTKVVKDLELLEISVVTIPANPYAKFKPIEMTEEAAKALVAGMTEVAKMFGLVTSTTRLAMSQKGGKPVSKGENMPDEKKPGEEAGNPAPAAEKPKDEKPEGKMEGEMAPAEHAMKVVELLSSIDASLKAIAEGMKSAKAEKPAEEKPEGEEAAEGEECAPKSAEEHAKDIEKMSDAEVEKELENVTKELEQVQDSGVA